jgi:hypothetical protein
MLSSAATGRSRFSELCVGLSFPVAKASVAIKPAKQMK